MPFERTSIGNKSFRTQLISHINSVCSYHKFLLAYQDQETPGSELKFTDFYTISTTIAHNHIHIEMSQVTVVVSAHSVNLLF